MPELQTKKYIDLFAGCGGLSLGLHLSGWKGLFAIEKSPFAFETLKYNLIDNKKHFDWPSWLECKEHDIYDVLKSHQEQLKSLRGTIDLVAGGPPCQGFSMAGKRIEEDIRNKLVYSYIEFIELVRPRLILFENVPNIQNKRIAKDSKVLVIDCLKKELVDAGYGNFHEFILDASKYGVPQRRRRFFILASRDPLLDTSEPPIETTPDKEITVQEAFIDIPEVIANTSKENPIYLNKDSDYTRLMKDDDFWKRKTHDHRLLNHLPMNHRKNIIERFTILKQGEGLKGLFSRLSPQELKEYQARKVVPKTIYVKRNYRLRWDEASPTVTSHCLDEFVHPEQARALTVRECARLQSFPDSYDFVGGAYLTAHDNREEQDKYEQIGDAIPPLLAYAWGMKIASILKD